MKLTAHDLVLVELLQEDRNKSKAKIKVYRELIEVEKRNIRNLSDTKIAEKFGVTRHYIGRMFAKEKDE